MSIKSMDHPLLLAEYAWSDNAARTAQEFPNPFTISLYHKDSEFSQRNNSGLREWLTVASCSPRDSSVLVCQTKQRP